MTEDELKLLRNELLNSQTYLEFGSGNSTLMAASYCHIQRMVVVESDDSFFVRMLSLIQKSKKR